MGEASMTVCGVGVDVVVWAVTPRPAGSSRVGVIVDPVTPRPAGSSLVGVGVVAIGVVVVVVGV